MEKAFNTIVADAAKVDAERAVAGAERRGARQAHAGVVDRRARRVAAVQDRPARDDDGRQRHGHRVAELSRQPRDGERRRRSRSTGASRRSIAARAATSSWRRSSSTRLAPPKVLTRTIVRSVVVDGQAASGSRSPTARCSKPITSSSRRRRRRGTGSRSIRRCPPALVPQMGTNVKFLIARERTVLAPRRARPRDADRRPGLADLARHRRTARRRRRRWSPSRAGPPPTPAVNGARRRGTANYLAELAEGLQGHPPGLHPSRASWTGRRIRGSRRRTPSPRRARSRRRARRSARASAGCTSPASTSSYAFMGYMEGALEFRRSRGAADRSHATASSRDSAA